ncbi:unnamed protein product [Trifolium pratense]|uniref:Uncharacterized protein n=1 Tax=Trifolium pratense TaxID=57577 RepID=A0ACB0M5D5_TRIPR|nr:unnamed protein product [Trifolium pratense]
MASTLSLTPSITTTSRSYLSHTRHSFRYPTIKLPSFNNNNCNNNRVSFKNQSIYNDAFLHFNVRSPSSSSSSQPLNWDIQLYDQLQNQIGGGKPKMQWYFKEHGWPSSTLFETPPTSDEQRAELIDTLQDWKTERYKDIIKSVSQNWGNISKELNKVIENPLDITPRQQNILSEGWTLIMEQ